MVMNIAFNLSLAWGMLVVSPLACRLFVLLGLPVSLLLDSVMGVDVGFQRILGVLLVTCGVAGFEASSAKNKTPDFPTSELGELEVENVPSDVHEDEAECIAAPQVVAEVSETSQSSSSSSQSRPRLLSPVLSSSIFCALATSLCIGGFIVASLGGA